MSFNLSIGTLDTMAGIFAPAKKLRPGSGGGSGAKPREGGAMLGLAVASMFPKPVAQAGGYRPSAAARRAFGAGSQTGASRRAIAAMDRIARRSPEVMVRITGRQHGAGHVLANFTYISRLGHGTEQEIGLETSDGEVIRDGRAMQDLAQDWQEWEMGGDARRKGATSLSMILSMPSGTDPGRLKAAALDFAREEFANRSWVASLHTDRDHPHVHLTFARRDHDGRRFHPSRDDLFRYRQRFAQKLRERGIDANATPAKARGVDARHEPIAARQMRVRGQVPRLDECRAIRAQRFPKAGRGDPVQALLTERHAAVCKAYARSIAELRTSPSIVDQTVANSLQRFLDTLDSPEPQSLRAAKTLPPERSVVRDQGRGTASEAGAATDPVVAALARSRAMRDRIEARLERDLDRADTSAPRKPPPSLQVGPHRSSADDNPPMPAGAPDRIDAAMQRVQERERDRRDRDRDRSNDKGGPVR